MSAVPVPFADLKQGDVVYFIGSGKGRGGHHKVTITVDKINRVTLNATETERSYGAGTKWRVHASTQFYKWVP